MEDSTIKLVLIAAFVICLSWVYIALEKPHKIDKDDDFFN